MTPHMDMHMQTWLHQWPNDQATERRWVTGLGDMNWWLANRIIRDIKRSNWRPSTTWAVRRMVQMQVQTVMQWYGKSLRFLQVKKTRRLDRKEDRCSLAWGSNTQETRDRHWLSVSQFRKSVGDGRLQKRLQSWSDGKLKQAGQAWKGQKRLMTRLHGFYSCRVSEQKSAPKIIRSVMVASTNS